MGPYGRVRLGATARGREWEGRKAEGEVVERVSRTFRNPIYNYRNVWRWMLNYDGAIRDCRLSLGTSCAAHET